MQNLYPEVIDFLMSNDLNFRALVIELAKSNPQEFLRLVKGIDPIEMEIMHMLKAEPHRWIAAIKRYRDLTGSGLKESKEAVERLMEKHGIEKRVIY